MTYKVAGVGLNVLGLHLHAHLVILVAALRALVLLVLSRRAAAVIQNRDHRSFARLVYTFIHYERVC